MIPFRLFAVLGVAAAFCALRANGQDRAAWSGSTGPANPAVPAQSWNAGPFAFSQTSATGEKVAGFRPFYVQWSNAAGQVTERTFLYPLYYHRYYGPNAEWSILKLINHFSPQPGEPLTPSTNERDLDIWPVYFSSVAHGDPTSSYHAVFPLGGNLLYRFGRNRISFVLWPLYLQTEKDGAITTSTPWPILHSTRGTATGFALWPLFGWDDRPRAYHREFYLWPLGWNNTVAPAPDAPAGTAPTRQVGALPFYSSERGPGVVNETYAWPFFGYTDRTVPDRYHENRYLWPLFVQGDGDTHFVNRWAPFYTHSLTKGYDKTWIVWPLWRQGRWIADGLAQTKTQFGFFLYWGLVERSLANPRAAPAYKYHVWPFVSVWNNGAGRSQWQVLSPLEVFFPHSDEMRQSWIPFFSLVRHDRQPSGETRTSLLWNLVSWGHDAARAQSSVRLFGMEFSSNHPTLATRAR